MFEQPVDLFPQLFRSCRFQPSVARVFERIVTGRMNAVAAVLRGDLQVEGDWRLLVRIQRLFPGPRRSRTAA